MAHSRQAIREAVVALLINQTDAGENVYSNRVTNFWSTELPSIVIYANKEQAVARDINGRQKIRTIDMTVEIRVEANELTDDTLDTIAEQVEEAIEENPNLSGTALHAILINTEIELDSDGERQLGKSTLTFEVKYIE